jgi:hypothetical protein
MHTPRNTRQEEKRETEEVATVSIIDIPSQTSLLAFVNESGWLAEVQL